MTNEEFIESIRLEGEEWRPYVGWEDYYMVSSLGRVVALQRTMYLSDYESLVNQEVKEPSSND